MGLQIQRHRGSTSAHADYIGLEGEITINTDTWQMHVHDGVTPGGIPQVSHYGFPSYAAMIAARIPAAQTTIQCYQRGYLLTYRRDAAGTAAITADGGRWSPANIITPDHWGAVGDGAYNDAPALRSCLDWAAARSTAGRVETVHLLGGRNYFHPGSETPITINGSIQIIGQGPTSTRYTRHDYTGRMGFGGGRYDALVCQVPNATFRLAGIGFHGDFGVPLTVNGHEVTVAYRFAGGNQYEGYLAGGSNTTIVLPDAPGVIRDDGAYDGHMIHIDSGSGRGTMRTLKNYIGATRTADLVDANGNIGPVIGGQAADATSYVQIGRYPPGMMVVASGLSRFEVTDCHFENARNQVLNHTNCRNVRVTDCTFRRCARGGISGRRNQDVLYARCMFQDCGDDIIFNAQELSGPGEAINTVVSDILAVDCVGMRFIGARRLQISNYMITRPMIHGLSIGHNGVEQPVNQHAIQISNVQIVDPLNRNAVAYDLSGGIFAGIQVISTSRRDLSIFKVPGTVVSGASEATDPCDMLLSTSVMLPPDWYQPTIWTKIEGCSVRQTLKPGQKVSQRNGRGTFYFLGTLMTDGYIDETLGENDINCAAVLCLGPVHKLSITENDFHVSGNPCILFTNRTLFRLDEIRATICNIDFDGALTDVVVSGNRLSGGTGGVIIRHQSMGTDYRYSVLVEGNVIDVDPYFAHPLRARDADGKPNGRWTDGSLWAIDANRCLGVSVVRNRIKNALYPWRGPSSAVLRENVLVARPAVGAVQGVYHPENSGVGAITADGLHWQLADTDCDPGSVTYLETSRSPLSAATQPASGWWLAGQRVRCMVPATGIAEWVRLTSGNSHVFGNEVETAEAMGAITSHEASVPAAGPSESDGGKTFPGQS